MITRTRILPSALLAAALLAGAVGCGVDTNDDVATGPTDTGVESTTTEAGGDDETTTTEPDDTTTTEPDEDTTTTAPEEDPDVTVPTLPPGIDEDAIRDQMATSFESLGLTSTQAECLADSYLREFGAATTSPDYSKMFDLFAECDIDPMSLGE